jgi:hypothetical protein
MQQICLFLLLLHLVVGLFIAVLAPDGSLGYAADTSRYDTVMLGINQTGLAEASTALLQTHQMYEACTAAHRLRTSACSRPYADYKKAQQAVNKAEQKYALLICRARGTLGIWSDRAISDTAHLWTSALGFDSSSQSNSVIILPSNNNKSDDAVGALILFIIFVVVLYYFIAIFSFMVTVVSVSSCYSGSVLAHMVFVWLSFWAALAYSVVLLGLVVAVIVSIAMCFMVVTKCN